MTTCQQIIAGSAAAFGTSGVRGLVEELNDATCFAYTLAFLDYLKREHGLQPGQNVWIGHDLRPSSPRIANACIEAVRFAGLSPVFCGEVPTPALAFAAQQESAPAIMITGSHIPFDRNGVKFYRADGEMMKDDEAPVVESQAEFPDHLFQGNQQDNQLENQSNDQPISQKAKALWQQRYAAAFPNLLKGMRIGHYQHSAAGRDLLTGILQDLGAEVVPLGRSDEFIPIDTEAVSESDKAQARQWRDEYNLDAIISTDGDGDRPLLADEKGHYFRGDMLGILAGIGLGADTVATPVSTNTALEKSQKFGTVTRTKIGSPHVIAAMQEAAKKADTVVVGFEPNGGFLMATPVRSPSSDTEIDRLPTRDALLPILATISYSKQLDLPLCELSITLPKRSTASDRLENTPTLDSQNFIASIKENVKKAAFLTPENSPPTEVNDLDGLRITFPSGDIVHLRPSGNAPELRIYVESGSDEAAAALMGHAKPAVVSAIAEFTSV